MSIEEAKLEIVQKIIDSGAIQIRDVDGGEEPFIYSSGNRGPGYIMIKGLCGQPEILQFLVKKLANKLSVIANVIDFVNGNVTGGMLPGWELRNQLSKIGKESIPYVYLRGSRKEGGHNELITGILESPRILKGMNVLIVEELVNYGETTINAIKVFRDAGYKANYVACILNYAHPKTMERFKEMEVQLVSLITLPELLDIAEEHHLLFDEAIQSYRDFLADSIRWQLDRGIVIPEKQAMGAVERGYRMTKLTPEEALVADAPRSKLGVIYWKETKQEKIIFVALDHDTVQEVIDTMSLLSFAEGSYGFKINLDILLQLGELHWTRTNIELITKIKFLCKGKPLFVDLKMWNGRRTMRNIVRHCVKLEVDIINVYPHIGCEALHELIELTRGTKTKLFVLTVLTHYDDKYCQMIYRRDMKDSVRMFAEMANAHGADGIILPPTCLDVVSDLDILKMCPGIRPEKTGELAHANDQVQIATPQEALEGGADYLVIGSSIIKAKKYGIRKLEDLLDLL